MTVNLFNNIMDNNDDFNFLLQQVGETVKINDVEHKAIITNTKLNVYINHDDRYISTNVPLQRGNLIEWNNKKWLIYSDVEEKRHHKYKAIMRPCNYNINFNIACVVHSIPAIIETQFYDTNSDKYMTLATGNIYVTLQENELTRQIKIDSRFIKNKQAFKVKGIDFSQRGLLKLYCEKDLFYSNLDDVENEIANKCKPVDPEPEPEEPEEPIEITIKINGKDSIKEYVTETFSVEIKQNGEIVDNNIAEWSIIQSKNYVQFVGSNTGESVQIRGTKVGETFTLVAKWIDDNNVEARKEIKVVSGW